VLGWCGDSRGLQDSRGLLGLVSIWVGGGGSIHLLLRHTTHLQGRALMVCQGERVWGGVGGRKNSMQAREFRDRSMHVRLCPMQRHTTQSQGRAIMICQGEG
jgi:hypothetical protein